MTKPEELTIFRCKVDSKRFADHSELVAHLEEKHSESFKVKRIEEQAESQTAETTPNEPKKRGRPAKKETSIYNSGFNTPNEQKQEQPTSAQ